ncbi:MAG: TIGR03936 family radical SAM-associated protein [Planctomycetes bacterium]|nr:TIGR03936 family radical SAM-associated protein [Planctomycetota bacterium]
MQVFERALRRAGMAVAHTQGFNPRPKLVFALALPLGVESLDEIVDVDLIESLPADAVKDRLGAQLPEGLALLSCDVTALNAAARVEACAYSVDLSPELAGKITEALERFAQSSDPAIVRSRKDRTRTIHLKEYVRAVSMERNTLSFELVQTNEGGVKPFEFLEWLGIDPLELTIVKTRTLLATS